MRGGGGLEVGWWRVSGGGGLVGWRVGGGGGLGSWRRWLVEVVGA